MRHILTICFAVLVGFPAAPGGLAEQSVPPHPPATTTTSAPTDPLTPAQIASGFVHLPIETQKLLMKILLSENSGEEKQATTEQLDTIFATLPAEIQKDLYAKWDALSDEQRIALKAISPKMVKALLIGTWAPPSTG